MRDAYDDERRERRTENREGKTPKLAQDEHRLMTLRHNYFSFVALEDACQGMELSLTASYEGSHPLLIVDGNNALTMDAAKLANLMYPDVTIRGRLEGTQSLVNSRKAAELIGFETQISAKELIPVEIKDG